MAFESTAHSAFGLIGYWLRAHSGSRNNYIIVNYSFLFSLACIAVETNPGWLNQGLVLFAAQANWAHFLLSEQVVASLPYNIVTISGVKGLLKKKDSLDFRVAYTWEYATQGDSRISDNSP